MASSAFKNYPNLTSEEFAEVCHYLDRRYCQATLGPVRRQWKLRVCTAFNTSFGLGSEYNTYLQIVRPLENELDDGDLSSCLEKFSFDPPPPSGSMETEADQDMIAAEEDEVCNERKLRSWGIIVSSLIWGKYALPRKPRPDNHAGYVTYEIHLHPTYQAPCLWFSLHDLAVDELAFSTDTVFRRLVPDQYKDGLRAAGGVGGISADYHPVTGVPSFFIHPCLLGEAMSRFDCSKETYLMVWLGLVGGCVGLWVPKEMALES